MSGEFIVKYWLLLKIILDNCVGKFLFTGDDIAIPVNYYSFRSQGDTQLHIAIVAQFIKHLSTEYWVSLKCSLIATVLIHYLLQFGLHKNKVHSS